MKKKTFYILLAVWILAVAVFAGVLIDHFVGKNDSTPSGAPSTEESNGTEENDDKNWTSFY